MKNAGLTQGTYGIATEPEIQNGNNNQLDDGEGSQNIETVRNKNLKFILSEESLENHLQD